MRLGIPTVFYGGKDVNHMLSSQLDYMLDDLLVDREEKTEPKPGASGDKIKQEIEYT